MPFQMQPSPPASEPAPPSGDVRLRVARPEDIAWVNARYDEVVFQRSVPEREIIAVGESSAGTPGSSARAAPGLVAAGRLVDFGPGPGGTRDGELGGIYVADSHRGQGLARRMVAFLLGLNWRFDRIFCLPFAPLSGFYESFGFAPWDPADTPPAVLAKLGWCNERHESGLRLLGMRRAPEPEYRVNERGLYVFTAAGLLMRGHCCGNLCRNCPYGKSPDPRQ